MQKLNLGCGKEFYEGYINVDINPEVAKDKSENVEFASWDIKGQFPHEDESIDEIILYHTIEHTEERYHQNIISECYRVLKSGARLIMAYPEFKICAQYYIDNKRGRREHWKQTIFGRQLYPSDYHLALMDTDDILVTLTECGFRNLKYNAEPYPNEHNTIITAEKGERQLLKDEVLAREIFA